MLWRDDVVEALRVLGGSSSLSSIYDAVRSLRIREGRSTPITLEAIVRRELEYNSSDSESYKKKHDLFYSVEGLGSGIWGLRGHLAPTPEASDFGAPDRVQATTYRILRDTVLAREIKRLHANTCQLCATVVELHGNQTYAEGHHLQPLGSPHNGPDVAGNIVVLCPTCHVLCDYFARPIHQSELRKIPGHQVSERFLNYHNDQYQCLTKPTRANGN
jgi:hypothetical protein